MKKEVAGVKCRRKVTYNDARERPLDQATHEPVALYEVPSEELGKRKPDFSGPKKAGKANKAGHQVLQGVLLRHTAVHQENTQSS